MTVWVSSFSSCADTSGVGPPSDELLLFEENFLNNFGVGIGLGKSRERYQDNGIQNIQDISGRYCLTPDTAALMREAAESRPLVGNSSRPPFCCARGNGYITAPVRLWGEGGVTGLRVTSQMRTGVGGGQEARSS